MFKSQITADGSWTFFSEEFTELFHSHQGAKQEAEQKFIQPCELISQAKQTNKLNILDICYGLGYNTAAALAAILAVNPDCQIHIIALESDLNVPQQAVKNNLLKSWGELVNKHLEKLATECYIETTNLEARLLIGDARSEISKVIDLDWKADAIFLDPFSPPKCPQLWTVEFINLVASCLKSDGRLATYSCAASVRNALQLAGLYFGSTPGVGRRSPGTVAGFTPNALPTISPQEAEHLQTRAAIPYRDPTLKDPASVIIQRRIEEQNVSQLEPSSHWKKRWLRNQF